MTNRISLQFTMAFAGQSSKQLKILHERAIYLVRSVRSAYQHELLAHITCKANNQQILKWKFYLLEGLTGLNYSQGKCVV